MKSAIASCLVIMTSLLVVRGSRVASGATSPMAKAFQDVVDRQRFGSSLNRVARSAGSGVPCVTVPYLAEMKERFVNWIDHNNDGQSTFDEAKDYLRKFKPSVSDDAVAAFIRRRDSNNNGAIDFVPEYVQDMSVPDYTLEGAQEWFALQDTNEDGYVDEKELINVALALGMSPEAAENTAKTYYMSYDVDKDGKLSFDEFKALHGQ